MSEELKNQEVEEVVETAPETEEVVEETHDEDEATAAEVKGLVENMVKTAVDAQVADIQKSMEKEVEAYKAKFASDFKKKAGLFSSEAKDARAEANLRVKNFLTALVDQDLFALKDMTGGTGGKGGFTIDTELIAEIATLQTEYGVARRECRVIPMGRARQLDINTLATDVSVYWTAEAGAKTSSDIVIGQENLTLNKLAVIIPWTDELAEDTEIDLISFLAERVAENFSEKEDEAFFNGDGTSAFGGFTGVLNLTGANTVTITSTSVANMDADDLIDMVDATPQGALANGKFYMHRSLMSVVRKLKTSEGEYIYQRPADSGPATIWGYPVVLVEAMPTISDDAADTAFVAFGDLRRAYYLGTKASGMKMDIATEATVRNTADDGDLNLFRNDMSALRVVERIGGVGVIENAVTVLKTATASA